MDMFPPRTRGRMANPALGTAPPASSMATPTPEEIFRAFTRLWVCTESVLHAMQPFLVPHELWLYVQGMLFMAAFAHPSMAKCRYNLMAPLLFVLIQKDQAGLSSNLNRFHDVSELFMSTT